MDGSAKPNFLFGLLLDYTRCLPNLDDPDAIDLQFWRRSAFRGLFGFAEAVNAATLRTLPHVVRTSLDGPETTDQDREYIVGILHAVSRYEYTLGGNGCADRRKRKLTFLTSLKAALRLQSFVHGKGKAAVDRDFSASNWQLIIDCIYVRDRLMHPHTAEDTLVSDDEVIKMTVFAEWLGDYMEFLMQANGGALFPTVPAGPFKERRDHFAQFIKPILDKTKGVTTAG